MTAEQSLHTLRRVLDRPHTVTLLVAADIADETVVERLTLHDRLADEFRAVGRHAVLAAVDEDIALRPYDPDYKLDSHELAYLLLADNADIAATVRLISQTGRAQLFTEDEHVIDNLRFYSVVLRPRGSDPAVFFRSYAAKKELGRSGMFAALHSRGAYNTITGKVFLFDTEIDCFACDGYLFIRRVSNFQRIFRYFEQVRERAGAAVDTITARVPIRNVDAFRAACTGQLQMTAKIVQIAKKPYLQTLTMNDIKRTIHTR